MIGIYIFFSYTSPEGQLITLTYAADDVGGFQPQVGKLNWNSFFSIHWTFRINFCFLCREIIYQHLHQFHQKSKKVIYFILILQIYVMILFPIPNIAVDYLLSLPPSAANQWKYSKTTIVINTIYSTFTDSTKKKYINKMH